MSEWYVLRDRVAVPVASVDDWARDRESKVNRRVAAEVVGDVRVSTVFLGLDHGYGDGPPLIFETMIFGGDHDGEQWRYSTWQEAEEGHAAAVVLVKQATWATTPDF